MRKLEIACNKQFLLFSHLFSTLYGTYFSFQMHFKMSSAICFDLDQSKIFSSGNGLKLSACNLHFLISMQVFFFTFFKTKFISLATLKFCHL